jgi:4-amino-4-deoxychorismate lyase
MCLLLETIKIENGKIRNLEFHNRRLNASRNALFGTVKMLNLGSIVKFPEGMDQGTYRCRILYRSSIESIEFIPHQPAYASSLKLIRNDEIDYSHKYANRELLDYLYGKREECDDILIVKNGFITDTSRSNIVFRNPEGSWITPDTPLLNGTMRMQLLETGRIKEAAVRLTDLANFTGARMINAMIALEESPLIRMESIHR